MATKYVPSYGSREIWIELTGIVDATIQAIKEKITSLREESAPRCDVIISEIVSALKEEAYSFEVGKNVVSFNLVELMLNTEKREIITLLPFLLTAYTLNYSANRLMKEATEKIENGSDIQCFASGKYSGYQQIFIVKGAFRDGEKTNWKTNIETLADRFKLIECDFPDTKFDNSLSDLDFNKSADHLHKIHIFSKFTQLCSGFDGVNLTLSLYAFQYYTLALSVLRKCKLGYDPEHPNEIWCDNCKAKEICFEFNEFSKLFPENSQDGSIDCDFNRDLVLKFSNYFLDKYPIEVIKEIHKDKEKELCYLPKRSYNDMLEMLLNQGVMSEDEYKQNLIEETDEEPGSVFMVK